MQIEELSNETWALTNPGGNFSNNGYPTRAPQTLPPNQTAVSTGLAAIGDGVIPFGHGGGAMSPRGMMLVPIGAGSNDNTFSFTVLGWRATKLNVGLPLWVPVPLMICQATLGSGVGIANSDLGASVLFADTITCSVGPTLINTAAPNTVPPVVPDEFLLSPTGDAVAAVFVRSFGFRFLEVIFTTGGSATSCNALYCKF